MPFKFPTPERCLLVQAAHWLIKKEMPVPDEVYLRAPVELKAENSELRELFLALQFANCDVRGKLVGGDGTGKVINSDPLEIGRSPEGWTCLILDNAEVSIEEYNMSELDFANNEINPDPIDAHSDVLSYFTHKEKWLSPQESSWVEEVFYQNVTVDFSRLRAFLSGPEEGTPPPDKRGAPPKYNWDQIWAEIAVRGDLHSLPETQAECISWISQWCINRYGDAPSETMLKEKLKLVYRHPEKAGK